MTDEELAKFLELKAKEIAEHCESVRIFVTKTPDDDDHDTMASSIGKGNFYAQLGQIQEWLDLQASRTFIHEDNRTGEN